MLEEKPVKETAKKKTTKKEISKETKAPKDYEGIKEKEVEIVVTFGLNDDQEMVINNVAVKDAIDVKAGKTSDQVMSIIVYNTSDAEGSTTLNEDEFGIDLRKVDTDLYQIATGSAKFTLKDAQTGAEQEIITVTLGRAELV